MSDFRDAHGINEKIFHILSSITLVGFLTFVMSSSQMNIQWTTHILGIRY
uniref:Uncharacterized protein n=1 Tax=Arundo donax TaxID=35708 RepID=A0A0A9DX90_ARUDO